MTGWLIFAACCSAWLLLVVLFPKKWAKLVDRENTFWVEKGVLGEKTAQKFMSLEKGIALKALLVVGLLMGAAIAFLKYLTVE